jgi:anti-sigma factor RsiW
MDLPSRPDSGCPSSVTLEAFCFGKLPDTELDEVALHLATCEVCQAAMRAAEQAPDRLVGALKLLGLTPAAAADAGGLALLVETIASESQGASLSVLSDVERPE